MTHREPLSVWRASRFWLVLLVLVGAASGAPPTRSGDAPSSSAERVALEHAVAGQLVQVNPALDPAGITRISRAVVRYSAKYGLDPLLVTAVLLEESSARPGVRSRKGAIGLMQVMPHMIAPLGLAGNHATIESNIEAGCLILAGNIRRLGERDGISAYFWGSQIRDDAYVERVSATRARLERRLRL